MNMEDIKQYIEEHRKFEMPDFQEQFSLSYTEANNVLEEFVKGGVIKFCDGFTYEVIHTAGEVKTEPVYIPKDDQEAFLIRALWECVKSGDASPSLIQRRLSCGYARASRAIDWMDENDFIGSYPNRKVKMSVEEYYAKFGNPDKKHEQSKDNEREKCIEERRRALIERLSRMSEDDEDEDDSDDDDDSDEEDDNARARQEYLEKRRAELIARMQLCDDDEDDYDDDFDEDDSDTDEKFAESEKFLQESMTDLDEDKDDTYKVIINRIFHSDEDESEDSSNDSIERKEVMQNLVSAVNKVSGKKQSPITADEMPLHPSWDNEDEFGKVVMERLERLIKSDKRMGQQGAVKKAETYLEAVRDTHDRKMVQVYERLVYEIKNTSSYLYGQLKKQFFSE